MNFSLLALLKIPLAKWQSIGRTQPHSLTMGNKFCQVVKDVIPKSWGMTTLFLYVVFICLYM